MPWPEQVPFLSQENICKFQFSHKHIPDCHDTARWLNLLFHINSEEYYKAVSVLYELLEDDPTFRDPYEDGFLTALILWNENRENTPKYIARTLNKLFQTLGYTEYEYV